MANKIEYYKIIDRSKIIKNGKPVYDVFNITLIYDDNTQKTIKFFADINTIDLNDKNLVEIFIIDRVNHLIEAEGRDNYIFLGKLVNNKNSKYISRVYEISGTNMNAQQYFDEVDYPSLKELYENNPNNKNKEEKQQGRIYNKIKSPFDDNNETLKNIIDIYANNEISYSDELYKKIVYLKNEEENTKKEEYTESFDKYIRLPNISKLYENIKSINFDYYDKWYATQINNIQSKDMSDIDKSDEIMNLINGSLYPISRFKTIFSSFENYDDINYWWSKNRYAFDVAEACVYNRIHSKCDDLRVLKNKYNLSQDQINYIDTIGTFSRLLRIKFDGEPGIMGFHVNPQNLNLLLLHTGSISDDIKFYINAGTDTYKFAKIFQEKCENEKLNYYFKVVNPDKSEHKREDKMCIYSDFENAEKFLEILESIKLENPDITLKEPPLLSGKIDNYIGIGTDRITGRGSYNQQMSKICLEAIKKIFSGIPKDNIPSFVDTHPETFNMLKDEIVRQATNIGLSGSKICIKEDSISKLREAEIKRDINESQVKDKTLGDE